MTALLFTFAIAALFALVLAWEAHAEGRTLALRPAGLLSWFVAGNWPAKAGALLLTIGTGALLRYLMLNIDFPATGKLMAGVLVATALGVGSAMLKRQPQRRAVHLALGGAALGVAYLTAYSAHGFFKFVPDAQALGALFIVGCGATVFALSSRAMSIAVLAMVGAFMAPAFALDQPGPVAVYGYYLLASLLVLLMVWQRGWRPLIHLSFLFTLAGGLFLGWTNRFYTPGFYSEMQPLLLLIVAIHLLMPLVEATAARPEVPSGSWSRRFDLGYFLLLPLSALILTLTLAPDVHREGAAGVLALAGMWALATVAQHVRRQAGAAPHGAIALSLALLAGLLWMDSLPYFLVGAVLACALLAMGPRLGVSDSLENLLVAAALACTACHLMLAMGAPLVGTPMFNAPFLRNAVLAAALGAAGWRLRQRPTPSSMATVFLALAGAWLFLSCARELVRLQLTHLAQWLHMALLAAAAGYTAYLHRHRPLLPAVLLLGAALFFSGLFSAPGFPPGSTWPLMLTGQGIFLAMAWLAGRHDHEGELAAGTARSLLPLLMFPWAMAFNASLASPHGAVPMTLLVTSALVASLQAQWLLPQGRFWPNTLSPVGFFVFGGWLFYQTWFHIESQVWAVAYEAIALAYLLLTVRFMPVSNENDARLFSLAGLLAAVSVALAMVLRLVGPPGVLTILALNDLLLPAVLSLCLVAVGGAMAWWAARTASRRTWAAGTLLLALAAAKLVFLDFDSLGQLGNILAMMAAGVLFMAVAWLAPIPPKPEPRPPAARVSPAPATHDPGPITQPLERDDFQATQPPPPETAETLRPPASAPRRPVRIIEPPQPPASNGRKWPWILGGLALVIYFQQTHHQKAVRQATPTTEATAEVAVDMPTAPGPTGREALQPPEPRPTTGTVPETPALARVVDACSRFARQLPTNYLVLASGDYKGRPLGYQAKPSNHEMTAFDVEVDEPGRDVVLALGAYDPAIWNIRQTRSTRIVGVIVSGYHQGQVNGLNPEVPVLQTAYDDHTPCGYFYIHKDNPQAAASLAKQVLAHSVDTVYLASNGLARVGSGSSRSHEFIQLNPQSVDRLRPTQARLIGEAGLAALVQDGKLASAGASEVEAWLNKYRAWRGGTLSRLSAITSRGHNVKIYRVLKAVELPPDMPGFNVFIVPSGVPVPQTEGRAVLLTNDPPECTGMLCG